MDVVVWDDKNDCINFPITSHVVLLHKNLFVTARNFASDNISIIHVFFLC